MNRAQTAMEFILIIGGVVIIGAVVGSWLLAASQYIQATTPGNIASYEIYCNQFTSPGDCAGTEEVFGLVPGGSLDAAAGTGICFWDTTSNICRTQIELGDLPDLPGWGGGTGSGSCSARWKCKDDYTVAYQTSDCEWGPATEQHCDYGCSGGRCKPAPPEPECNFNGEVDLDTEDCDKSGEKLEFLIGGTRYSGETPCSLLDSKWRSGNLDCVECEIKTTECEGCGDGELQLAGEECDAGKYKDSGGNQVSSNFCGSINPIYDDGTVSCTADCTIDYTNCSGCGDDKLSPSEDCDIVDGTPKFNERCEQIRPGYFEPGYPQAVAGACVDCKVTELGCARLVPIVSLGDPSGTIEVPINNRMVSFDFTIQQGFYEPGYIIHARKQGETSDFATYPISGYEYLSPGILPTEISGKEIEMDLGNFEWFVEIIEKGTTEVHETPHKNFTVEREVIDGDGICDIGEFIYTASEQKGGAVTYYTHLAYAPQSDDCPPKFFKGNLFFEGYAGWQTSIGDFYNTSDGIALALVSVKYNRIITNCGGTLGTISEISNPSGIVIPIGGFTAEPDFGQGSSLVALRLVPGDGKCLAGENYLNSPDDCPLSGHCPNTFCELSKGETFINCPFDCPAPSSATITVPSFYETSICNPSTRNPINNFTNTELSAEISCGNGSCELGENYLNCEADCHA